MANKNCLKGLRCPRCKYEKELEIVVRVWALMTDDGCSFDNMDKKLDWTNDSKMQCPECNYEGVVRNFRIPEGE